MREFFEKHPTFLKITAFPFGLLMLYGAFRYGLLGFLTGQTEIISKFSNNHPIANNWLVFAVSAFSLYIGLFMGIMLLALALGYKGLDKYFQNKLIQILFLISVFGYFLVLCFYPIL